MTEYRPERVLLEDAVEDSPVSRFVLDQLPDVPVERIPKWDPSVLGAGRFRGPRAKRTLVLTRFQGRFFKPCPCRSTRGETLHVCCDYRILNFGTGCSMDCSYCYLQSYLDVPCLVVYANVGDLLVELEQGLGFKSGRRLRIGTGELVDSLGLDPITGYSRHLVEFFARRRDAVLELKTKSAHIQGLLGLDHQGRTVVGWSMSPPAVQKREEHRTAAIPERLAAAAACVRAGYRVAFHFDPMIDYPGWRQGYRELVEALAEAIPAASIAWFSMGSLRMTTAQRDLMKRRFPRSRLALGELVPGLDGKLRYFKPIRQELYRAVGGRLRELFPEVPVFPCSEGADVWRNVFGEVPESEAGLGCRLAERFA